MKVLYLFLVGVAAAANGNNNEAEVTVFEKPRPTAQVNDVGLQPTRRPPPSVMPASTRQQQQISNSPPRNNKVFTMVKAISNTARPTAPAIAPSSNNSKHSQKTRTLFTFSVDSDDIDNDDDDVVHASGKKKVKGSNRKSDDISNHIKQDRDDSAAISIAHLNYKAMVTVSTAMAIFGMGGYF